MMIATSEKYLNKIKNYINKEEFIMIRYYTEAIRILTYDVNYWIEIHCLEMDQCNHYNVCMLLCHKSGYSHPFLKFNFSKDEQKIYPWNDEIYDSDEDYYIIRNTFYKVRVLMKAINYNLDLSKIINFEKVFQRPSNIKIFNYKIQPKIDELKKLNKKYLDELSSSELQTNSVHNIVINFLLGYIID